MKLVGSARIVLLGLALSVPLVVHADTNALLRTPQHSSSNSKSMKAFQKQQRKQQKKTKKAQAKAQKTARKNLKKYHQTSH
jgi:hypothetical protein